MTVAGDDPLLDQRASWCEDCDFTMDYEEGDHPINVGVLHSKQQRHKVILSVRQRTRVDYWGD